VPVVFRYTGDAPEEDVRRLYEQKEEEK